MCLVAIVKQEKICKSIKKLFATFISGSAAIKKMQQGYKVKFFIRFFKKMASVILWEKLPSGFQSIEEAIFFFDKRGKDENQCKMFAVVVMDAKKVSAYTRRAYVCRK